MNSSKITWIYAGLGLAAGVGLVIAMSPSAQAAPSNRPAGSPKVAAGDRVLLIGDSLALGLSLSMKQLAAKSNISFFSDGRVSTNIRQWARNSWLPAALSSASPTMTLVSLGTNDMKQGDPTQETTDLKQLVQTVLATGSQIAFIAPPTMPFPDRGVRAMIDAQNQPVFRSDSLKIPRASDGIHPTASGYAGWSGAIWQWLTRSTDLALGSMPLRSYAKVSRRR